MNRNVLGLLLGAVLLVTPDLSAEIKVSPVGSFTLLGGQYWMTNSVPTALAGNANAFFSPVINFSASSALLPIYTGSYRGTKDVRELVGGGTLTQESQDHSLSLKYVYKLSPQLRLKARGGYKIEFLKETKDETWGKGLFDYKKIIGGVEVERFWNSANIRAGADYYTMVYPNYQSLVTQDEFQTSIDTMTYAELSTQAGTNILDYSAVSVTAEYTRLLPKNLNLTARYDLALKNFVDQKIVDETGEFTSDLRKDAAHYLTLSANLGTPRAALSIADSIQYYASNQNSFDAANSKYTSKYYDFIQNAVTPSVSFALGAKDAPVKFSLLWELSYRLYAQRLAQNDDASYKDSKVNQLVNTMGFSISYPLTKNISARLSSSYSDSSSNMRYEKNYKYNYYSFNYFAGVTLEL
ncbi:MAG TPA: hypothetical protein DEE98_04975 [Elusimicrobia bacterium]|nr:MAG: hypothetical protein A2278_04650 [Elusimicrobia bacterium RIFOXYA12_FULL_49_49]OGS06004.1 MAG: hypothetical protein A2204_07715 [Elusimicrobia bacterium RIFOXYA1_FULL_47_7]OGS14664.1 MAG: hypothetical protein A2251_09190 [Elusimicrobia bacterium RIFOXYA2_FULL_47_53]OGS25684.1 MAG: hypothetical protein A2339_06400 [Elusimicrobia bacterium RIFOXYB12_FULL_50_12]OGS31755.1 MAG: hypothetical protein A2323_06100 [Elusimicrobia bacterium RIFOXYB2_FULL_46_23]HBU69717.1 hypothetical protein [El